MDITLFYFEDCPNWKLADERLTAIATSAIAAERDDITVTRHLVDTRQKPSAPGSTARRASWSTGSIRSPSPARGWGSRAAGT